MLRRLLQNLISNAIKYTPKGRVLVGCRRKGTSLQIGIYDTGLGIPILKRSEIFKEFHRLDQGARIARGLGLGLSIVERLARVLNHGIVVDSNRSGGSRFSVMMPIAKTVTFTAALSGANISAQTPMSGTLIVCIENDRAILDGMRTLLTGWDAKVIAAVDPDNRGGCHRGLRRTRDRPAGRLSSRPRQRHRRDPRHPPEVRSNPSRRS